MLIVLGGKAIGQKKTTINRPALSGVLVKRANKDGGELEVGSIHTMATGVSSPTPHR